MTNLPFSKDDIPKKWTNGVTWEKVSEFQKDFDLKFKETDLELFLKILAFAKWVYDHPHFDFMLRAQGLAMVPADNKEGTKPSEVPVLGFSGCKPGSEIPVNLQKILPQNNPPNSLRNSEIITSSNGVKYNRGTEIEHKVKSATKYREGVPSTYMSKTPLSLHKPNYPSVAIWELDFHVKRWGSSSATSFSHVLKREISKVLDLKDDKIFFDTSISRKPRLFVFSEKPTSSFTFKESMFGGFGKLKIDRNRIWFDNN